MTTTTIISHHYLQHARHWPEDFTDLIKPYTKPNEVAFFSFYRCGIGSTGIILSWPKSHRECGRMRFLSMCLSQQLLFTSTDAITPLSTWPGSCVHRLPAAPSDLRGEAPPSREVSEKDSHTLILDMAMWDVVEKWGAVARHQLPSALSSQLKIEFLHLNTRAIYLSWLRMKQLGTDKQMNSKIQPLNMIKLPSKSQYLDCIQHNQS